MILNMYHNKQAFRKVSDIERKDSIDLENHQVYSGYNKRNTIKKIVNELKPTNEFNPDNDQNYVKDMLCKVAGVVVQKKESSNSCKVIFKVTKNNDKSIDKMLKELDNSEYCTSVLLGGGSDNNKENKMFPIITETTEEHRASSKVDKIVDKNASDTENQSVLHVNDTYINNNLAGELGNSDDF